MSDEIAEQDALTEALTKAGVDDPVTMAEAKRVLAPRTWPVTVKLTVPVEFGKQTIESLVFQKGTFGMLKGLNIEAGSVPNLDALMMIASRLCGQPIGVIERLDPDDADEVTAVATSFFVRCRGGGRRLSGS